MPEPLVVAIMLTRDRPAMARRAVESFRAQTYPNKTLVIIDTNEQPTDFGIADKADVSGDVRVFYGSGINQVHLPWSKSLKPAVGSMRNAGNTYLKSVHGIDTDIFVHWDDDDWSHPNRIAEQVSLLQSSKSDAVGYREVLAWRTAHVANILGHTVGEAFSYSHPSPSYVLGGSLCYWRSTWERKKFEDVSKGEDSRWIENLKIASMSGAGQMDKEGGILVDPSMIIGMHGGNTCNTIDPAQEIAQGSRQWKRVPEWDAYAAERMRL